MRGSIGIDSLCGAGRCRGPIPGPTFAKSATFNQDLCVKRFYPQHLVSQQLDWQLDPIEAFIVTTKLG
jgi:hypothetical protein